MQLNRLKYKYLNIQFLKKMAWSIFRLVILIGLSFVILYPFFTKISSMFMGRLDLLDSTVKYFPRTPTLSNIKYVIREGEYYKALLNTVVVAAGCAFIQTMVCSLIGYGLAKFKFRGRGLVMGLVIFNMIIPPQTILIPLFMKFRFFDIAGIFQSILGGTVSLLDTPWPVILLSLTGFGFKNGLYIFMMRQFFRGVPEELEDAAYVDGAGTLRTFFRIIMPISIPTMITIGLLSFSWQWTDSVYSSLFFDKFHMLPNVVGKVMGTFSTTDEGVFQGAVLINTSSMLIIAPLIIVFLFVQRKLVEGIERSGIVG